MTAADRAQHLPGRLDAGPLPSLAGLAARKNEPLPDTAAPKIESIGLNFYYGHTQALRDISVKITPNVVTAFIGPSGCGKSTVLRTLNRMHEVIPNARVEGKVMLDDVDLYGKGIDAVAVRRTIGMVFQRPNRG